MNLRFILYSLYDPSCYFSRCFTSICVKEISNDSDNRDNNGTNLNLKYLYDCFNEHTILKSTAKLLHIENMLSLLFCFVRFCSENFVYFLLFQRVRQAESHAILIVWLSLD